MRLDGRDILAGGEDSVRRYRWKDIAMVFQGAMNALNPVKTVRWQIAEPMAFHGVAEGAAARQRAGELLEMVGIHAAAGDRYPHEFSGGMRQRASIAMALACEPRILLADEPTTALDVMVQAQILELLTRLSDELGLALILVTHDLPVVAQTCERAAVMYAGEIAEQGPMETLFHQPRHPYTRLLFAATPDLYGNDQVVSIPGDAAAAGPGHHRLPVPAALRRGGAPVRGGAPGPAPGRGPARGRLPSQRRQQRRRRRAAADEQPRRPAGGDMSAPGPAAAAPGGPAPPAPLLEVEDLRTDYPVRRGLTQVVTGQPKRWVHAVDGVSFSLAKGEMMALVGESGCGKTSTVQTILGMVKPAGGAIRLNGTDIAGLPERRMRPLRRTVQVIYQDPYESLDPRFRVRETVEEPMLVHDIGGSRSERQPLIVRALEQAGLTPAGIYLDRYPHELSGGQRQRVAIAASLVLGPQLLLADEPVSMLDVSVRAGVLALLDGLRRDADMGILMITHDLSTAAHFADRIAVMYLGRIVEHGSASEVVRNPQHPYTKALLSVVPKRDPRDRSVPQILTGETPDPANMPPGCRFHPRCPVAVDRCRTEDPKLGVPAGAAAAGHLAACHLA